MLEFLKKYWVLILGLYLLFIMIWSLLSPAITNAAINGTLEPISQADFLSNSAITDYDNDGVKIGSDSDDYWIYLQICDTPKILADHIRQSFTYEDYMENSCEVMGNHTGSANYTAYPNFQPNSSAHEMSVWEQVTWTGSPLTWGARDTANAQTQYEQVIDFISQGLIIDLCDNIEGVQETMPDGYEDPDVDRTCTEIDLCSNLNGIQYPSLPQYYEDVESDGICTPVAVSSPVIKQIAQETVILGLAGMLSIGVAGMIVNSFRFKP